VQEPRGEHPSLWAAIESIAPKIGCVPQTLHEWVCKHEIDTGLRDGV
jgi:transposase-like protein